MGKLEVDFTNCGRTLQTAMAFAYVRPKVPAHHTLVTQSDVKNWMRCQQAFNYSRVQNLEPRRTPIQLIRGTIIHELLQAKAEGYTPKGVMKKYRATHGKLFEEERAYYGQLLDNCWDLYEGYEKCWETEKLRYVLVEHQIGPHQLTDETWFTGKLDGLAIDKHGRFWIVEHKTHKKYPDEGVRLSNMQVLIYAWGLEQEGELIIAIAKALGYLPEDYDEPFKVAGIIWDYIKTDPPTKPERLKNGRLSTRKNIDTDYDNYVKAIIANGEDPEDPYYEDILDTLANRGAVYYKRIYLPIQRTTIGGVLNTFKRASLQIHHLKDHPSRNLAKECGWCSFQSLCMVEVKGLDSSFVREAEFTNRQLRYSDLTSRDASEEE